MNAMNISVAQAGMADIDAITPLFDAYRQFYGKEPDAALAGAFIRERLSLLESVIFIARSAQGEAVGFTQLYPSFSSVNACRIWILNDLFVQPSARGMRAGSALLQAAREHAVSTGARRIDLSTAHDNPARKLYEAHGYVREEGFCHYSLALSKD